MIRLAVDGRACDVREGTTILRACREVGVDVPTLCHLEGVTPAGSCRVCLVEVRGLPRPVPACATVVWPGMEIATSTPDLVRHRRAVVEMLFAGGDHVCAVCPASGRCELQELARALGLDHVTLGVPPRALPVDASHARFALDPGRCVLCTRCVRVCAELERAGTLFVAGHGRRSRVVTDGGGRWASSPTCTGCGRCVAACPTGALLEKALGAQGLGTGEVAAPPRGAPLPRPRAARAGRLATVQLGGCAGCHMSLLDAGAGLLDLAARASLVASPFADEERVPEAVDVCLVEGACSTEDDVQRLREARERSRVIVALGDCAGWGNVTAMRDAIGGAHRVLERGWGAARRDPALPALLDRVLPVPEVVAVDLFLAGCPPCARDVLDATTALLAGETPVVSGRFG